MVRVGVWEAVYRIQGLLDWDGRPVISAIKTDILRCRLSGRRGPWGSAVFDPSPRGRVDRDQLFRRQHVGTLGDGDALIGR